MRPTPARSVPGAACAARVLKRLDHRPAPSTYLFCEPMHVKHYRQSTRVETRTIRVRPENEKYITLSGGSLGSCVDEERSQLRELT